MEIKIDENSADQRLDRFLRKYCKAYPDIKLSDIFSWIRKGVVKVISQSGSENLDGENRARKRKEDYRLKLGDVVVLADDLSLGKKNPSLLLSQKDKKMQKIDQNFLKNMIVFENENWIVFDKPAGVILHPSNKHRNDLSMQDYLVASSEYSAASGETFKPSFCYRLDKDTSGVLIAAKNYEALKYLNELIRTREVDKMYLTVVGGEFPEYLKMDKSLEKIYNKKFDRSQVVVSVDGKKSLTEAWNMLTIDHKMLGKISFVKVKIHTGRMHQIRVHLADQGYPVLGDIIYGNPALNRILYKNLKINRQLLHCWNYSFWDKFESKKAKFETREPRDFFKLKM